MCAIKTLILREGIHSDTSFILGTTENTNLAIGGFLAGLHRSPLTFLFAFFRIHQQSLDQQRPRFSAH